MFVRVVILTDRRMTGTAARPNVCLLAQMLNHLRYRVMMMVAVASALLAGSLFVTIVVRRRRFGCRRVATVDAALRDALRELAGEAAVIEPVPVAQQPVVGAVRAGHTGRGVLVERMEPVVALEQQIALMVRRERIRRMLMVRTGVREILMVRLVLVDVVQIVRKVAGSSVVMMVRWRTRTLQRTTPCAL